MTTSIDYKKELKALYGGVKKQPHIIDVPPMNYLMIDGKGDPNVAQSYADAVTTLYNLAYAIRFAVKKAQDIAFTVMPLQGLWWMPEMTAFTTAPKSDWLWTMMIMQPDWITQEMIDAGIAKARGKLGDPPPSLRLEDYDEGLSVQTMHVGPYSAEAPTIARMHNEFMPENGLVPNGHHHEIYLGDPRKVAPEKLKTVLRQPVKKA